MDLFPSINGGFWAQSSVSVGFAELEGLSFVNNQYSTTVFDRTNVRGLLYYYFICACYLLSYAFGSIFIS